MQFHTPLLSAKTRVEQLQIIQKHARIYYLPVILHVDRMVGLISNKTEVIERLSNELNSMLSIGSTRIEIDQEKLRQLDHLLFRIHIYSAIFLFKTYEEVDVQSVQENAKQLFAKKNADYGDAFAKHGCVGVLVRMHDKLARYVSVSKKPNALPKVSSETQLDTLLDLNNYSAMALMVLHNGD